MEFAKREMVQAAPSPDKVTCTPLMRLICDAHTPREPQLLGCVYSHRCPLPAILHVYRFCCCFCARSLSARTQKPPPAPSQASPLSFPRLPSFSSTSPIVIRGRLHPEFTLTDTTSVDEPLRQFSIGLYLPDTFESRPRCPSRALMSLTIRRISTKNRDFASPVRAHTLLIGGGAGANSSPPVSRAQQLVPKDRPAPCSTLPTTRTPMQMTSTSAA